MASEESAFSSPSSECNLVSLWQDALSEFNKASSKRLNKTIFQPQYSSIEEVLDDLQEKKENFALDRKSGGKLSRVRSAVSDHFPVIERAVSFVGFGVEVASQVTPFAAPGAVIITGLGWVAKACKDMHDSFDKIADFYGETAKLFGRVQMLEGKLGPHCNYFQLLRDITDVFRNVMKVCAIAIDQPQTRFKTFFKQISGNDELGHAFRGLSKSIDALESTIVYSTAANVGSMRKELNQLRLEGTKSQKEVSAQISDGFNEMKAAQRARFESQERRDTDVFNQLSDGFGESAENLGLLFQGQRILATEVRGMRQQLELYYKDHSRTGYPYGKKGRKDSAAPNEHSTIGNFSGKKRSKDPAARKDTVLMEIREEFHPCDQSAYIHELSDWAIHIRYNFLQEYSAWVDGKSKKKVLIVTGAPGIGKTYLSLSARGTLKHQNKIVASFFFREGYSDFEGLGPALRSIITQLAECNFEWCRNIHMELNKLKPKSTDEDVSIDTTNLWCDILEMAGKRCMQQKTVHCPEVYIIFDGIDEAGGSTQTDLIRILMNMSEGLPIRVLITTRELANDFQESTSIAVEAMSIDDMRPKLHNLCKKRIQKLPRLRRFPKQMKQEIASELSKYADCMLYIENMLLRLEAIGLKHLVRRDLNGQHRPLPTSLNDLYAMMLNEIQKGRTSKQCDVLRNLFAWLAFSNRHLTLREATEITKLSEENSSAVIIEDELVGKLSGILELVRVPEDHINDEEEDSSTEEEGSHFQRTDNTLSVPQIMIDEDDSALPIQFQERCLRDFFKRGGTAEANMQTSARAAHLKIFTTCVQILHKTATSSENISGLLDYAANYWSRHFIQLNHIVKHADDGPPSTEEKVAVVEALATVHLAEGDISKTLERYSFTTYSGQLIAQGQQWPELVGWWAKGALGSEGLSDKSARWIESVNKEGDGKIMSALAHAHAANWADTWNTYSAYEAFRFARDALCLTDLVPEEEKEVLSSNRAESVFRIADLLITTTDNGSKSSAIAIIQELFECKQEAYVNYQQALDRGMAEASYNRSKSLAGLARVSLDPEKAAENATAALGAADSIPEEGHYTSEFRIESKTEALLLLAWIAVFQRNDGNVIHYIHKVQEMQTKDAIGGFMLDCLTKSVEETKGIKGLYQELHAWSDENRSAWLDWAFRVQNEASLRRFEDAAMSEANVDLIIDTYQGILDSYNNSTALLWAQLWKAKTHHFLGGTEIKAAKGILKNLLDGRNIHRSKEILYDARLHLSKILYEEFRSMDNPGAKRALLEEMRNIPQLDPRADQDGLSNSLVSIPRARMMRVLEVSRFQKLLTSTFNVCINALRDDDPENDFRSLRLLAQVLTCVPGLEGHARMAISLQFSDLGICSHDKNTEIGEMATDDAWFASNRIDEYLASQADNYSPLPTEKGLSGWSITCDGCGFSQVDWKQASYYCLICTDIDLCENCFNAIRNSDSGKIGDDWRVVCGKDHKYIRAPLKGWGGVQNGIMKIGQQRLSCMAWLKKLEKEDWLKAWKQFWRNESFIPDII